MTPEERAYYEQMEQEGYWDKYRRDTNPSISTKTTSPSEFTILGNIKKTLGEKIAKRRLVKLATTSPIKGLGRVGKGLLKAATALKDVSKPWGNSTLECTGISAALSGIESIGSDSDNVGHEILIEAVTSGLDSII
jgi:hypothetical protein